MNQAAYILRPVAIAYACWGVTTHGVQWLTGDVVRHVALFVFHALCLTWHLSYKLPRLT